MHWNATRQTVGQVGHSQVPVLCSHAPHRQWNRDKDVQSWNELRVSTVHTQILTVFPASAPLLSVQVADGSLPQHGVAWATVEATSLFVACRKRHSLCAATASASNSIRQAALAYPKKTFEIRYILCFHFVVLMYFWRSFSDSPLFENIWYLVVTHCHHWLLNCHAFMIKAWPPWRRSLQKAWCAEIQLHLLLPGTLVHQLIPMPKTNLLGRAFK